MRMAIYLQITTIFCGVNDVRHRAEPLVPEPSCFEVES